MAGSARAEIIGNASSIYTTEDLCELTLGPDVATVNANGTQTFSLKFGTSANMQSIFEEWGIPPQIVSRGAEELPETISYYDTIDACVFGDVSRMVGLYIKFEVISGPDAGLVFETELAADGTVTFPLTNNGALGTDQIRVTATLPQVCLYAMKDVGEGDPWDWSVISPAGCEEGLSEDPVECSADSGGSLEAPVSACGLGIGRVRPVDLGALPGVILQATAAVNWTATPSTPVVPGSVRVSSVRSCSATRVRIRPTYSSNLRSARLIIDGKTVQTKKSSSGFVINTKKYKPGKHRFKVVATYDTGPVTSNTGSFTKCKVKVSLVKVKPKFTG